jgi:hypothetical protein
VQEKKYDNPVGLKNKNKVLEAIAVLRNPRPQDILDWINDPTNSSDDFVNKLLSTVTERHTTIATTDRYLPERIQKKITTRIDESNDKRISIRAVQYWCAKLVENGLIEHLLGGRYTLTDKVRKDVRFLGSIWNMQALYKVFNFQPKSNKQDRYLQELITRLGAFVIYTLIQSTKPFDVKVKDNHHKDTLALEWIQNAISLEHVLMSFLATFIPIVKRGYSREPRFELSREKYNELSEALRKAYPDFSKELMDIQIFPR